MARSKAHLFDPKDQLTSLFFRALSHPARLNILRRLAKDGPCTVENLNTSCPLSQPTLSQHLKILRKTQLVSFNEKFPHTLYKVNDSRLKMAYERLTEFFNFMDH